MNEDGNPLKPMVHVNDSVIQGIWTPGKDALVKHLGKNIGFSYLARQSFDYLMVKFDNEVDSQSDEWWVVYDLWSLSHGASLDGRFSL